MLLAGCEAVERSALFWEKIDDKSVRCELCPHRCIIPEGKSGMCRVRACIDGTLIPVGYGRTTSLAMDPMEKKPLFHFKPGKYVLSVAVNGCNFRCRWCQNWEISQMEAPTNYIAPEQLVAIALRENSIGICFTYTEPFIWYEYILDTAKIARPRGLAIILVTNGYINQEPLEQILPLVDAMNIDLKSMRDETYRKYMGGTLQPVLNTIKKAAGNTWIEITNLVIPTVNDDMNEISKLVAFVESVDSRIPLHFSRYYPAYLFRVNPTSQELLINAFNIAKEKLPYVYIGNIIVKGAENTYCPHCGNVLIERKGYSSKIAGLTAEGKCSKCFNPADIVM